MDRIVTNQLKLLHTYKPITNVFTDSIGDMGVEYYGY